MITQSEIDSPAPDFAHWCRMARWDVAQAAALSLGLDPEAFKLETGDDLEPELQTRYLKRRALVLNHVQTGRILHSVEPVDFLSWAQSNGIEVHAALVEAVESVGGTIANWRLEAEQSRAELSKCRAKVDEITGHAAASNRRTLLPKEEASLLKIVLGVAMAEYGFAPGRGNSRAPKAIADALRTHGITIDEDTVRKWLVKAADEVDRET